MSQISAEVRTRVRASANNQCGYCQSLQRYVLGILEIEHIIPKAAGGSDEEENLWLACRLCNSYKGAKTQEKDPESEQTINLRLSNDINCKSIHQIRFSFREASPTNSISKNRSTI